MNLNQITIPSINIKKFIDFHRTLGLKLIVKAPPHYARFVCPDGNATFYIHLVDSLPFGEGISAYFESTDLDNEVIRLIEKGIRFEQEPTDQNWLWREARLKDLDGNQIILYFAGENRLNPPWRIK